MHHLILLNKTSLDDDPGTSTTGRGDPSHTYPHSTLHVSVTRPAAGIVRLYGFDLYNRQFWTVLNILPECFFLSGYDTEGGLSTIH